MFYMFWACGSKGDSMKGKIDEYRSLLNLWTASVENMGWKGASYGGSTCMTQRVLS